MRGSQAFSPTTGSPLSDDKHQPGRVDETPLREALDGSGELTLGASKSTRVALQQYFDRAYRQSHHGRTAPAELVMTAGRALYELKRHAPYARDDWVWIALCEYLIREGHWSTWMHNHVEPSCPRCSSRLRWKPSLVGLDWLECGSSCGAESHSERSLEVDRLRGVREPPDHGIDLDRLVSDIESHVPETTLIPGVDEIVSYVSERVEPGAELSL
jgi:hypothetical protein